MKNAQRAPTPELTEPVKRNEPDERSWIAQRMRGAILFYQRAREGRPSPCRFFPSCSSYALEAVEVHGAWRGGRLTARRLLRCRPLGPSGFDPVPEISADRASTTPSGQVPVHSSAHCAAQPTAQKGG